MTVLSVPVTDVAVTVSPLVTGWHRGVVVAVWACAAVTISAAAVVTSSAVVVPTLAVVAAVVVPTLLVSGLVVVPTMTIQYSKTFYIDVRSTV